MYWYNGGMRDKKTTFKKTKQSRAAGGAGTGAAKKSSYAAAKRHAVCPAPPELGRLEEFLAHNKLALNEQQKLAAARIQGPTLLLAVPGSGKTTVIITRTGFMIQALGIPAASILTLTFSRASAADLKARYVKLFGRRTAMPHFSTIHSFALSVIRRYEAHTGRPAFKIVPGGARLIREVYADLSGGAYLPDEDLASLESALSLTANMMYTKEDMQAVDLGYDHVIKDFEFFYKHFKRYKIKNRLMDFDDILVYAYRILKKNPALLKEYREHYPYIQIDEAQDTSLVQHSIIKLLAGASGNLLMVGDEDQSIYGFRGAFPDGLLSFEKDYQNAQVLFMETNYRATTDLVKLAGGFIGLCEDRFDKRMTAAGGDGLPAVHEYFKSTEALCRFVLSSVRRERKSAAVLYRNNESGLALMDLFEREGEPFCMREQSGSFFKSPTVRDIRAFYEFAQKPVAGPVFERLRRRVDFGVNSFANPDLYDTLAPGESIFEYLLAQPLSVQIKKRVRKFQKTYAALLTMKPEKYLHTVLEDLGYGKFLERQVQKGTRREYIIKKLDILETIASRESLPGPFFERLDALSRLTGSESADMTFSTIHSAKGLEFDKVFMIDVGDKIFPPDLSGLPSAAQKRLLREEMRLFYVGVTRAKTELEFLSVGRPHAQPDGYRDSRFVSMYFENGRG